MTSRAVKVRYVGLIENIAGDRQEKLHLTTETTVGELVRLLAEKHGGEFRYCVFRNTGELRPSVTIQLGDRDIQDLQGLNTSLPPDAEVALIITGYPDPGG